MLRSSLISVVLLLVILVILSAGCDTVQPTPLPPTPTVTATATATSSPTATAVAVDVIVPQITQARSIEIVDSWSGYSSLGAVAATYNLERTPDVFAGKATFSAHEESLGLREVMTDVVVPTYIAESFLTMLAEPHAQEGIYDCMSVAGCCDHYPSLSIEVQVGENTAKFYSCSKQTKGSRWASILHGGDRIPWALEFIGTTYVINSARPAEAYAILNSHLKKDMLANLIQEVGENPDSGIITPTARPPY